MKKFFSYLLHPFSFNSSEMRTSYSKFNKEVEMKLLTLIHAIIITSSLVLTANAIIVGLPLREILIRIGFILGLFLLFFLRKTRWLNVYKFFITALGSGFLIYNTIMIITILSKPPKSQIFLTGNALGMLEIVFVLSFKTLYSRLLIFSIFLIVKTSCLHEEILREPRPFIQFTIFVIQVFVFCLYHDILDRKIFGLIYKASEKIKKFQDLLSNDLPSSVMVMSLDFKLILYSNKFFQLKFAPDGKAEETTRIIKDLFGKLILQGEKEEDRHNELKRPTQQTSVLNYLTEIGMKKIEIKESQEQVRVLYASCKEEDGEFYYEVRLRRILWDDKHSYAIVMNDITDKQMVAALKIADAQKDRVIATVSHELRTPINGILGLLEMASDLTDDTTLQNYLENCKSCSKLLLYLVNAILDLSQLRNNSLKIIKSAFRMREMIEEVRSLYIYQSHQKSIDFIIEKDPSVSDEIYTDKYRLIEVLINLLGNAMKFTFNGFVKLKISKSDHKEESIVFCVEDTGIGIKKEDQKKLFRMFGKIEQLNHNINTHGVGLGLTIANELVKALNSNQEDSKIMFESEYNKGSQFWFELDISNNSETSSLFFDENFPQAISEELDPQDFAEFLEPSQTVDKKFGRLKFKDRIHFESNPFLTKESEEYLLTLSPKSTEGSARRQVLLVDDNPLNLMAAGFILEKMGFSITKGLNGQEGIRLLEEGVRLQKYYSFILTDIQMPVMDGLEMSQKIKEKIEAGEIYPVPIVALTAKKVDQKELEEYKEFGIIRALEKPLIKDELEKVLADLLQ